MPQSVLVFFQAHCRSEWTVLTNRKLQWDVILQITFSGLASCSKTNTQCEAPKPSERELVLVTLAS